jgi:hypothetical protein
LRFLVEEDEEALKKELKNAFEFYDKVITHKPREFGNMCKVRKV